PEGGRVARRPDHRRNGCAVARAGRGRVGGAERAARRRAADADRADDPSPAPRLPRRRLPRHRRGSAPEPREERHRRVTGERRGVLAIAGAALLWSTGGVGIKLIAAPPLKVACYRSALAALTLLAIFRPRLGHRSPTFFAATVCYGACLTTFVTATKWTTAANAIFLQYSGVVWVILLAPLVVGEAYRARDTIAILVALA